MMLVVPHSRLWIFPENYCKCSTSRGGDRIETCSPRYLAPFSERAVCALALQPAPEQGRFWLAAVLSPASVDPLAAAFLVYCSQLLSLCLKSHAAVPARDGGLELG